MIANNSMKDENVLSAIRHREDVIQRAHLLVSLLLSSQQGESRSSMSREMISIGRELRMCGLKVVQEIAQWTLSQDQVATTTAPMPYCFADGPEYLCKMMNDLDFISDGLGKKFNSFGIFAKCDPLVITRTKGLDRQTVKAAYAATLIIIDAFEREKNRQLYYKNSNSSKCSLEDVADLNSPSKSVVVHQQVEESSELPISIMNELHSRPMNKFDHFIAASASISAAVIYQGRRGRYKRNALIGEGAYAKVYECERADGRLFAAKVFNPPSDDDDEDTRQYTALSMLREIECLKRLKHSSIVSVEESIVQPGKQLAVDRSARGRPSPIEAAAKSVLSQLLAAIGYLHANNYIHRDIKPENVLVSISGRAVVVKLADFGSIREITRPEVIEIGMDHKEHKKTDNGALTHYIGSRWYRAPEVLGFGDSYGPSSDIWALGCTIFEFISGFPLFKGTTEQEVVDSILSYYPPVQSTVRESLEQRGFELKGIATRKLFHSHLGLIQISFRALLDRMLYLQPEDRDGAADLLKDLNT